MIHFKVDFKKLLTTCLIPVSVLLIHDIAIMVGDKFCQLAGKDAGAFNGIASMISYSICILIFGYFYFSNVLTSKKHAERKKQSFLRVFSEIILVLLLGLSLQFFISCILSLIYLYFPERLSAYQEIINNSFSLENGAIRVITVMFVAPVAEELVFRGIVLSRARQAFTGKYASISAVFFTALCFGIYHGNLVQFCYALLIGIILGLLAIWSSSLLPSVLLHIVINVSSYLVGFLSIPTAIPFLLSVFLLSVIALILIYCFYTK